MSSTIEDYALLGDYETAALVGRDGSIDWLWFADSLLLTGRREEALQLFERLLMLRNDVGLLAEQYDAQAKRLVGNFPQALSHIALVNTTHNLTRSEKPVQQRSGRHVTTN